MLSLISVKDFLKKNSKDAYFIEDKDNCLKQLKTQLDTYKKSIKNSILESSKEEERCKNFLRDFLKACWQYTTDVKHDIDLSLVEDGSTKVIIETKDPKSAEMITDADIEKKAFYQAIFYYMEQHKSKSYDIKHIIITNFEDLYIFDSAVFNNIIKVKKIQDAFKDFAKKKEDFYARMGTLKVLEKKQIAACKVNLFDDAVDLEELYRLLDKPLLFKKTVENDANMLNKPFYNELLYILGLEEKEGKLAYSKTENTLLHLTLQFANNDEALARRLNTLWLNRILFLKLVESQLRVFRNEKDFGFLTPEKVTSTNDLHTLFFDVLAHRDRKNLDSAEKEKYRLIPYLNSSLFEEGTEEGNYSVARLKAERKLKIKPGSILYKDPNLKDTELPLLEYFLRFLNCFHYNSDKENEDANTVIKSSVLGLIFEKLNGYADGAHFTPAIITMAMCKKVIQQRVLDKFNSVFKCDCSHFEELVHFCKTLYKDADKEKAREVFDSISILDPAVGSGHFLVSSMNELIRIKHALGLLHDKISDIEIKNDELIIRFEEKDFKYQIKDGAISPERQKIQKAIFDTKKTIIEKQLYGVDVNPNSVNICRLRLWIELLKHTYYTNEDYIDLEVLPNLEFKIAVANTLIPLVKRQGLLVSPDYTDYLADLKKKFGQYFSSVQDKDTLREEIKKSIMDIKNHQGGFKDEAVLLIETFDPFDTSIANLFFDSEVMFGMMAFDIVIGNPPYFSLDSIKKKNPYDKINFETYVSTGDIYQLFMEKALKLIKKGGLITLIISNKWMRAGYGKKTRQWLHEKAIVDEVIDLGAGMFDSATVDTNIIQYRAKKESEKPQETIPAKNGMDDESGKTIRCNYKGDSWIIASQQEAALLQKMQAVGKPLRDWDVSINYGIKTGYNEAFIIDQETKDRLVAEDKKSEEILKPILRGRDITRYGHQWAGLWLIFIPWHFPLHKTTNISKMNEEIRAKKFKEIEEKFEKDYSVIYKHLKKFEDKLYVRNKAETGIRYEWYALQRCAATYYQDFEKPKIVWKEMGSEPAFSYDSECLYLNDTCRILTGHHALFLLSVFNSIAGNWVFKKFLAGGGLGSKGIRYKSEFMKDMPIPVPTPEQEALLTSLVEQVLELTKSDQDTTDLEAQIDAIVYTMYELSEEEIALVEEAV